MPRGRISSHCDYDYDYDYDYITKREEENGEMHPQQLCAHLVPAFEKKAKTDVLAWTARSS